MEARSQVSALRPSPLRAWAEQLKQARRIARGHPTMAAGLAYVVFVSLVAILAPWIERHDPLQLAPLMRLQWPTADHWFGTDQLGRDIYARTVHGARLSLMVGFSVAVVVCFVGVVIGLAAGYERRLDNIVMRFMDGLMAFPALLLAIALMAILGASVRNVIIVIAVVDTPRMVRLVRACTLGLREQTFVEAARALGVPPYRILFRHILPNTVAPLTVQATFVFAQAVLVEAALSFLGAGTPTEIPSWGNIISVGQQYVEFHPWMALPSGVALTTTVLAMNLVGDGLRDVLDPKLARRM